MRTQCNAETIRMPDLNQSGKPLDISFDAGRITSDAGLILISEVAKKMKFFERLAECFEDKRDQRYVEHSVETMLAQRILGFCAGYEDLNDHQNIQDDAFIALMAGVEDIFGQKRSKKRDHGRPLASPSSLGRIERGPQTSQGISDERPDIKITHDKNKLNDLMVQLFIESWEKPPDTIIIDPDATDIPLHGSQENRFYHGYYKCYCYLPLYIFCGEQILDCTLRAANQGGDAGALERLKRIVGQIRKSWPSTHIIIRADSGFTRDPLMSWCEKQEKVDYILGLAKNNRLKKMLEPEMVLMREKHRQTGEKAISYVDLRYQTLKSWSTERRVIGKAEVLPGKDNPRFVVTSISKDQTKPPEVYQVYCGRGDMENRIKEQLSLFADRTSAHQMQANQMRLYMSAFAYILIQKLRQYGLFDTPYAKSQVWSIQNAFLKIGAVLKLSVRRFKLSLSSVYPRQSFFWKALRNIQQTMPSFHFSSG